MPSIRSSMACASSGPSASSLLMWSPIRRPGPIASATPPRPIAGSRSAAQREWLIGARRRLAILFALRCRTHAEQQGRAPISSARVGVVGAQCCSGRTAQAQLSGLPAGSPLRRFGLIIAARSLEPTEAMRESKRCRYSLLRPRPRSPLRLQGLLDETHTLEIKREIAAGSGANKELARDLASFAIDGGTYIVGVDETTTPAVCPGPRRSGPGPTPAKISPTSGVTLSVR